MISEAPEKGSFLKAWSASLCTPSSWLACALRVSWSDTDFQDGRTAVMVHDGISAEAAEVGGG